MKRSPSKAAEWLLALLIPPACREYVLGDLHERDRGPLAYFMDALSTVPLVILSRIRRTLDWRLLLMEACALYISFLGAVWPWSGLSFFAATAGLLRLAIAVVAGLVGLVLVDAYTSQRQPSLKRQLLATATGLACTLGSQALLWIAHRELVLPAPVLLSGCGMSLLLVSMIRLIFGPGANRRRAS